MQVIKCSPSTKKFQIKTSHNHFYSMQGVHTNGKGFQECMQHGVDADEKCTSARLSLTFRLTAHTESKLKEKYSQTIHDVSPELDTSTPNELKVTSMDHFSNVTWDAIFSELQELLDPDVTQMYGKVYENSGRMSAEIMHPAFWTHSSDFVYKYGNKKHVGKPMGPIVSQLCEIVKKVTNQEYDWVHVTYYPSGIAKLSAHADNEPEIAKCSIISCLTFMSDPLSSRNVFVKGNDSVKKRKK